VTGDGMEEGIGSVHRENEPSRDVKAMRLLIGEKSRPEMAPSGLVYLLDVSRNTQSPMMAYRATNCLVSVLQTRI